MTIVVKNRDLKGVRKKRARLGHEKYGGLGNGERMVIKKGVKCVLGKLGDQDVWNYKKPGGDARTTGKRNEDLNSE